MKKRMCLMLAVILSLIMMLGNSFESFAAEGEPNYLTFTAEEADSSVTVDYTSGTDVEYSLDGQAWVTCPSGTEIPLKNVGDSVKISGRNIKTDFNNHFKMTGKIAASGSVTSLTDGKGVDSKVSLDEECYSCMFYDCTSLTKAPELPAEILTAHCYSEMFYGCKSLTEAPELPAKTLASYCYSYMFSNCTSLTKAPELSAKTLADFCYINMFSGCTSLTKAPELPAKTLASYCCSYMFSNCTSLTEAPELPAEILTAHCYRNMFSGCTSLIETPELPAKTLADYCYYGMFEGCNNLLIATKELLDYPTKSNWVLPLAKDVNYAYTYMFKGASTATDIPEADRMLETPNSGTYYILTLPNYLTFTAEEANSSVTVSYSSGTNVEYSLDGITWFNCPSGTGIPLNSVGNYVKLRGQKIKTTRGAHFKMTGKIAASGSVTSLTDGKGEDSKVSLDINCYGYMFSNCTSLTEAPKLPAETLAKSCYDFMFSGCTSLTEAPELPATTMADYCYYYMFNGCTSLIETPELSAKTLAAHCYSNMFSGCTSLTKAPELPAETLAAHCYSGMFSNCTSLTEAPELPAETLADYCYSSMFMGCTSLTEAPELPAETLAEFCYYDMFSGCTSLTKAPELPAVILADYCYSNMFSGCISLTEPPELPAKTLADYCYYGMFKWCYNLLIATGELPDYATKSNWILPSDEGVTNPYGGMFEGASAETDIPMAYRMPGTPNSGTYYILTLPNYLTFTAEEANSSVTVCYGSCIYAEYSLNGKTWFNCPSGTDISLKNVGDYVKLSGQKVETTSAAHFKMTGKIAASGSVTSLTDEKGVDLNVSLERSCYSYMFSMCTSLTKAPELPATTLADNCYFDMFSGCTSLTKAPKLPSTTLTSSCYGNMFSGCTSLTKAPELPAKTLTDHCYSNMFSGCKSLTEAPVLPATTMASSCYESMFGGCTSLTKAPELPATTMASSCYSYMFKDCTSLTEVPELKAETLADSCYLYMFKDCNNLLIATKELSDYVTKSNLILPSDEGVTDPYYGMFEGASTATDIPEECRMPGTPTSGKYYILEEIKEDPDPGKPDPDPGKPDPDPGKPDPDPGKPDPDPDNPDPNPAKPEIKYVVPDDVTLIPPSEEGKMPTAEKNGVVFAGWKDENGNIINDPNLITKDTILTPLWENITVVCKQKLSISYIFKNALDSYKESVKKEKEASGETFKENKDLKYRYRVLNKKEYSGVVSMNAIGIRNQSGTASVTGKGILNCKKAGTVAIKLEVKVKNGKKTEWLQLPGSEIIFVSIEKPAKIKDAKTTLRYIGDSVSFNGIVKYDRPSEIENIPNMSKLSVQIKGKNDVVSYDETTGNFVANKNGKAMITATYNAEAGVNKNGEPVYSKVKITFTLKVKIPEFKKAALKVKTGKTVKTSLKNVTKKDTVTYTSSNEAVATVDAKGKVTGVSAGTAVITADVEGKTYTCEVTVE